VRKCVLTGVVQKVIVLLCTVFFAVPIQAQINLNTSFGAGGLVQQLVGTGVTFTNANLTCNNNGSARFSSTNTALGIDSGVVLTTGRATSGGFGTYGVNANALDLASIDRGTNAMDLDLYTLSGLTNTNDFEDLCKLEFDFVPQGDTLRFQYKFASEEYPDYNCTDFNDIFAFFISGGTQYPSSTNLAIIPGTTIPVAINSINDGTVPALGNTTNCTGMGAGSPYTSLYYNNSTNATIVYDGMTKLLTATALVSPCTTYHMKFAIADIFDGFYDSGVFLKAGSFSTNTVKIDGVKKATGTPAGWPFITEGCISDTIVFKRPYPTPLPQPVYFNLSGTATNGADYTAFPTFINIPANDTMVKLPVTALTDALTEGTETINVRISATPCSNNFADSILITIKDYPMYSVTDNDTVCIGQNKLLATTLSAPDTAIKFLWKPGNIPGASTLVLPLSSQTYTVTASYPGCPNRDSTVSIFVSGYPTVNAGPDVTICDGASTTLVGTASTSAAFPIATYLWNPGATLSANNISNPVASPTVNTTYTVTAVNIAGCTGTDAVIVNVKPLLTLSAATTAVNCANAGGNISITTNASGAPTIFYTLQPGNVTNTTGNFTSLSGGVTYTITTSSTTYCNASTVVTLTGTSAMTFSSFASTNITCNNADDASITAVASGGTGTINYQINSNPTQANGIYTGLAAGTYVITAMDALNCTVTSSVQFTNPSAITITGSSSSNVACNGLSTGVINVVASGGTGAIGYSLNAASNVASGNYTNLAANNYVVVASDANTCSTSVSFAITEPPALVISNISTTNAVCSPSNSGNITISASGGNGTLTYNINSGSGYVSNPSNVINNLIAQTYTVQVLDANSCSITTIVTVGSVALPVLSLISKTNVLCFGGNNGTIATSVSGGTPTFSYSISPSIINNLNGSFSNATNGTYVVTVTDGNLCTSSLSVSITQPSNILFGTTTATGTNCSAAANGTVSTSALGGVGTLTFTLVNTGATNTTGSFSALAAGTYVVEVADANGCTKSTTIAVTQPGTLTWGAINVTNVNCNNAATGTINVNANGGTGTKLFSINGGTSTASNNWVGLVAGSYAISVSDANNCSINTVVTITEPPALSFANITNTPLSCSPGNDASIAAIALGGAPSYTFTLNGANANTTGTFNNLTSGIYIVQVLDSKGCTYSLPYNIAAPSAPTINSINQQNTSCVPNNTGSISVNASGTSALQYSNGGAFASSNNFSALIAGNYVITVKDASNCTTTSAVAINTTPLPIIDSVLSTLATCVPGADAILSIYATGNSTLQYSTGGMFAASSIFNNMSVNTYTITVKDNDGCTSTTTRSVIQATAPSIASFTANQISCFNQSNGSINVTITPGTSSNITVNLSGAATQTSNVLINNFGSLTSGNYTVQAVDNNGCSVSTNTTLIAPAQLFANNQSTVAPSCFGGNNGTATYVASGGTGAVSFSINPSATQLANGSFSGLQGNVLYTITALDANNCSTTTTLSLVPPTALIIGTATVDSATCYGTADGSIAIVGSTGGTGSYTYSISPGGSSNSTGIFTNLSNNGYTITIKDAQNCTATLSTVVLSPTALILSSPVIAAVTCNGAQNASVSSTASGSVPAYTYSLTTVGTNTTGNFANLNGGNYVLSATDSKGCVTSKNVSVAEPAVLSISNISIVHAACNGTSTGSANIITIGGNSGNTYLLNPGAISNTSGNYTALAAGSYTVLVSDSKGCSSNSAFSITQPAPIVIDSVKFTSPSCSNASNSNINIYASGGSGSKVFSLQPGTASNTTGQFTNIFGGTYTIQVTDANGCSKTTTVVISAPSAINIQSVTTANVVCAGDSSGSATITAIGGTGTLIYSISILGTSNITGSFTNLPANFYTITIKDANNCTASSNISITENTAINATNIVAENPKCAQGLDGFITLDAVGGVSPYSYNFNFIRDTNVANFQNLGLGTYTITITDNVGCKLFTTITLNTPQNLIVTAPNVVPTTCFGVNSGTIAAVASFGNFGGYVYTCQPGIQTNTSGIFTNLAIGSYTIVARDSKGCNGSIIVQIVANTNPIIINFSTSAPSCYTAFGNDGSITPSTQNAKPPVSYYWPHILDSANSVTNLSSGTYTVIAKDSNGCVATDTVSLPTPPCCTMMVPNAFTPNGDGNNDKLRPVGPAEIVIERFDVYDRWGNRVFSNTDNSPAWDGTAQGTNLDMDTYFYLFRYKCVLDNEVYEMKGDVILMR
jgi:large repetitive protein